MVEPDLSHPYILVYSVMATMCKIALSGLFCLHEQYIPKHFTSARAMNFISVVVIVVADLTDSGMVLREIKESIWKNHVGSSEPSP